MAKIAVAPLVGAWIEIVPLRSFLHLSLVAPLVGAWIEIGIAYKESCPALVAPLVGAWIEISKQGSEERRVGKARRSRGWPEH